MKVVILGGCGYIGSRLFPHLSWKHEVDTVDLEWFGNYVNPDNLRIDFRYLGQRFYSTYDAVILLAGHSSVKMCEKNMSSTFQNNVVNFIDLMMKLSPNQKFIYASSSSLYAGIDGEATEEESCYLPENYYDLSKKEIDMYAALSGIDFYGLRFGTVNGPSLNMRADLMINKMFMSAVVDGKITIFNRDVRRPILGINDLCRAVSVILDGPKNPGVYNVASFNATVMEIAESVKLKEEAEIIDKGSSPTYDFHISTKKFEKVFDFKFEETTDSIAANLKEEYKKCNKTNRDEAVKYA